MGKVRDKSNLDKLAPLFPDKIRSAFGKMQEMDRFLKERYASGLKPVVCLPDLDELENPNRPVLAARYRELLDMMRKGGMVRLADLSGQIDAREICRLVQAVDMESQRHGDFPLSPEKVWVRVSDVTNQPTDDSKVLWFTPAQLAAKYHKDAQTMRLWAQEGFFIERGYLLKKDPTRHWFIGIPPAHADYQEFLAFSQSIKKR